VPRLSFADDVYDLVVCNLGLDEMPSVEAALRDFSRVAKRGGEVRCTLALAGTYEEFHDLYREVLIKHDKHEQLARLERHIARYPTLDQCEQFMAGSGLVGNIEIEEFTLLFKSSREFFFAPVIEYGPLPDWKDVAGGGQEMQDVFWYIKEAIDAYYEKRPFQVTIKAGCIIGRKQEPRPVQVVVATPPAEDTQLSARAAPALDFPADFPGPGEGGDTGDGLDTGDLGRSTPLGDGGGGEPVADTGEDADTGDAHRPAAEELHEAVGEGDHDLDSDEFDVLGEFDHDPLADAGYDLGAAELPGDGAAPLPPPPAAMAAGTVKLSDPDELEVQELADHEVASDDDDFDIDVRASDVELDAFVEGRPRPTHLKD
jgi:hypothetical protein